MSFYIAAQDGSSIIVAFDICENEEHVETSIVTAHPVESGIDVVDHIRNDPSTLSMVFGVTQTPIEADPDQGRGGPITLDIQTPQFSPPFDFTPGAIWREAAGLLSSPQPAVTSVEVFGFSEPFDRIREVEQKLLELRESRALCRVVTLSRDYEDLAIARWSMRRESPGWASFAIDFQQVRVVSTASVAAPQPQEPRGEPKVSKGQQTPTSPFDVLKIRDQMNNSILLGLFK